MTMRTDSSFPRGGERTPSVGRPTLFVLLLVVAALGVLALLVVGPSIALPLAVTAAAGLIGLVVVAWAVAGPRL